jgi:Na+/H+ antiporter NhaD/arsenite permease-like protein
VRADQALHFIDFGTLVLLFSMMLVVGCLRLSGFFDWITGQIVTRLKPRHLLPTVIFITGVLSAFFVNDIICLVMVPFALAATKRMGLKPLPYLLAVATASNIGSVATITGNPQNMLIGSFSGLSYSYFLWRLGPVALIGLLLDWLLIRQIFGSERVSEEVYVISAARHTLSLVRCANRRLSSRWCLAGFLGGVPPAMMAAIGAALMLITRTRNPRLVYDEVDWGLPVFFVGLFVIVGGAENAGLIKDLFSRRRPPQPAERGRLHRDHCAAVEHRQQCAGGHGAQVAGAVVPRSANRMAGAGHGEHSGRQHDDHWLRGEPDRCGACAR